MVTKRRTFACSKIDGIGVILITAVALQNVP